MSFSNRHLVRIAVIGSAVVLWMYVFTATRNSKSSDMIDVSNKISSKLAEVENLILEQRQEAAKLLKVLSKYKQSGRTRETTETQLDVVIERRDRVVDNEPIPVVVFACNRPAAVQKHIMSLLRIRPSRRQFPIIVSLDCNHVKTEQVVRAFGDAITLIKHPNHSEPVLARTKKKFSGYYKIARHYRWALSEVFYTFHYNACVVTEDDLEVAPDFFSYFSATYSLLKIDTSLFCVSAWNDNGKPDLIEKDPTLLHRTDFFPGLGWMLTKDLWNELEPKWPESFWDDWMRASEQRKNRACIRPEISRTAMALHGKIGVSKGQYYEKHLKHIKLNQKVVDFEKVDLSYLLKDTYDQQFVKKVYSSPEVTLEEYAKLERRPVISTPSIRFTYTTAVTFKRLAQKFQLMDDFRAGVPRTAYRGVVSFYNGKLRIYISPPGDWKNYNETMQ